LAVPVEDIPPSRLWPCGGIWHFPRGETLSSDISGDRKNKLLAVGVIVDDSIRDLSSGLSVGFWSDIRNATSETSKRTARESVCQEAVAIVFVCFLPCGVVASSESICPISNPARI